MSVTSVTGTSPTYQWVRSATSGGTFSAVIDGTPTGVTYGGTGTSATLNITAGSTATAGTNNYYKCVVSGASPCTIATSASAALTISTGIYYSKASGTMNWTDATWGTSPSGPFNQSLNVTGSSDIMIQSGGTVNLNNNYTSTTGAITISGTLNIPANITLSSGANLTVNTGGNLNIANSVSTKAGLSSSTNGTLILNAGTFTLNGSMDVNGYFQNDDANTITYGGSQTLTFENYSVCELNNVAITAAPTATWASNSNLLISAIAATGNLLTINKHYGNFIFNFPSAGTGHILTSASSGTIYIDGNFTLINSNGTSGKCKVFNGASGDNITVKIGGDLSILANSSGQLQFANSGSYTALDVQIGGSLTAGTGWIGSGSATTTLELLGTGTNNTINTAYGFSGFTSISVDGTYTLNAAFSPSSASAPFIVSGTLNCGAFALTGKSSSATFTLSSGATLETKSTTGQLAQ